MPDRSLGAERADGAVEGRVQLDAVWAAPVAFQPAIERVATGQAAWVDDPREGFRPGCGQVPIRPLVEGLLRDRAIAGKDQVDQAAIQVLKQRHRIPP